MRKQQCKAENYVIDVLSSEVMENKLLENFNTVKTLLATTLVSDQL